MALSSVRLYGEAPNELLVSAAAFPLLQGAVCSLCKSITARNLLESQWGYLQWKARSCWLWLLLFFLVAVTMERKLNSV